MKLEFNNTTLHIPSAWDEVKLGDYEKWFLKQPETKAEYVAFVAHVCNTSPDVLLNAPTQVFNIIVDTISFIFKSDFEPANHVLIAGQEYFVADADSLTLGEWVDVESVLESDCETKISDTLAILCRPVGESYDTRLAETRKTVFRNLSCDKVMPLVAFFLFRKRQYEKILHLYSTAQDQTDLLLRDIDHLAKSGDGIKSLPTWQQIRYTFLIRSLKNRLSKYSDFSSTAWTKPLPKKSKPNLCNRLSDSICQWQRRLSLRK